MFSLTIVFGPGPMVWTLMFKTKESAEHANDLCETFSTDSLFLCDDFGQKCAITGTGLHGYMLEDLDQSKLAHIERALHQTRTKLKADELADADPAIRQARRQSQGGLGMIQPMPGGMVAPNGRFAS